MGSGRRAVEVVSSKGCTALLSEAAASFRRNNNNNNNNLQQSPVSDHQPRLPFSGLVICIIGLSKETRKQVKEATEKLGGIYSPNLHSEYCTHLVLQSTGGLKLEDKVLKQAPAKNNLSLVTIGWFVDSVRKQERLSEDLYSVNQAARNSSCHTNSIRRFTGFASSETYCLSINLTENSKCFGQKQKDSLRENIKAGYAGCGSENKLTYQERQDIVTLAKNAVRSRRRGQMQTCSSPMLQEAPNVLLDSICWNISDPATRASTYADSFGSEAGGNEGSIFFDAKSEASAVSNFSRPLNESEKSELILRYHILTILFPVDRYAEMGPSSRSFFSEKGFTCLEVLDHIYTFYQENLTAKEIEIAIQTDSRHADLLRLLYSSKEAAKRGSVAFKRLHFLGSRKSFKMLKRVPGDAYSAVYELLIRA